MDVKLYQGLTSIRLNTQGRYSMHVSLTPQLEELVKRKVESGLYNSASEVVREALRLLGERDRLSEMRLEELRKEIQRGLDSGPATPVKFAEIKRKGRQKLAEQGSITLACGR